MDTELAAMPVIDIDTHYTEPRDLWMSRAPQKLRDLAPRVSSSCRWRAGSAGSPSCSRRASIRWTKT